MASILNRLAFFLITFKICESYSHWGKFSRSSTHLSMSKSGVDAPSVAQNWRTISLEISSSEVSSLLSIRSEWSDDQLQDSLDLYNKLIDCKDSYVAPLIRDALTHLDHAYRLYGPRSVVCSYNGGKDAVVILHLLRAAAAHYYECKKETQPDLIPERPRVIYFDHKDEFPEILSLLHDTVCRYDLDMIAFQDGISFMDGLRILVEKNFVAGKTGHVFPMAFVLGTRSTDPNAGGQGHFAPSSHYMPPFMRVNPVLDWQYGHIWHFLRLFKLPYCVLYDQGYTSLGTVKDTKPCPALEVAGSSKTSEIPRFWPAYMLQDWDLERAGRIKKGKKETAPSAALPKNLDTSGHPSIKSDISTITGLGAAEKTIGASVPPRPMPVPSVNISPMSDDEIADSPADSFSSDGIQRTVGLLVIGDEILKGITADVNIQAAATALRAQSVPLSKVSVVSDCQEDIVDEIKRLKRDVDIIITSGGVGPTHDDVTIKSVAVALNKDMIFHEPMAQLLRKKMSKDVENNSGKLTQAQIKMATLPSNGKLRYLSPDQNDWPTLQCQNIFILPGVPQFFSKKMKSLAEYLSSQMERSITYKIILSVDEASIVPILNKVVEDHPDVCFGSYPFVGQPDFKTVVTLEGRLIQGDQRRNSYVYLPKEELQRQILSKEQMDRHVKMALDDLVNELERRENGSVLRVDNDDGMLFS